MIQHIIGDSMGSTHGKSQSPVDAITAGLRAEAKRRKFSRKELKNVIDERRANFMKLSDLPEDQQQTAAELMKIPNIGPVMAAMLMRLDIYSVDDLVGQDPDELYQALCTLDGRRYDPCVRDVFAAAVAYANGGPARPWWEFSRERKARLKELAEKQE